MITPEAPSHFILLVKSLRECDRTTLIDIYGNYKDNIVKKEWLLNAMAMTGTVHSVKLIKTLVEDKLISTTDLTTLLINMFATKRPTETILDDIMTICKSDMMTLPNLNLAEVSMETIKSVIELRRSCFLTFSILFEKLYKDTEFFPSKYEIFLRNCESTYQEPITTINKGIKYMDFNMYKEDPSTVKKKIIAEETKLMCLKSMGNAGLKSHVDNIVTKLKNEMKDNSLEVRVNAIYALQRIAPKLPKKIMSVLMPFYRNPDEDPEIRIVSYLAILETKPTPSIYTLLAEHLNKETSRQVGTFVYSHLMHLANTTHPCMKYESQAAHMALRFARPFVAPFVSSLHYSHGLHKSFYNDNLKMGGYADIHNIFTQSSIVPRFIKTKINVNIFGQNIDLIETGIRTEGLQYFVEKIFGPKGFWEKRQSLFDFLKRRNERSIEKSAIRDEIDILKEKVKSRYRMPEEPKGSMYVKMFGDEIFYKAFNKDDIKNLLVDGKIIPNDRNIEETLRRGDSINYKKATLLLDTEYQEPTILGIPVSLNITSGLIMKLKAIGRAEVKPELFTPKPTGVNAHGITTPNIMITMLGKMGVDCTLMKTGIALNATTHVYVPIEARAELNMEDNTYKVNVVTQEEYKRDLITFEHNLYTYTTKMDKSLDQYTKINGVIVNTIKQNTTCLTLLKNAFAICSEYKYVPRKHVHDPMYLLTGPSHFQIYSVKGYDMPKELQFELKIKDTQSLEPVVRVLKSNTKYELKFTTLGAPKEETFTYRMRMDISPEERKLELIHIRSNVPEFKSKMKLQMTKLMKEVIFDWEFGESKPVRHPITTTDTFDSEREYRLLMITTLPKTDLSEMHIKTVYTELPTTMKTICSKIETLLPKYLYKMFYNVEVHPTKHDMSHTVELFTKLVTPDNIIEMLLKTPLQEIRVRNITLPVPIKNLVHKKIPGSVEGIKDAILRKMILPTCIVENNVFKTFDNVTYMYEMPGSCLHVLAKDCSPSERFVVLLQNKNVVDQVNVERNTIRRNKIIAYVDDNKIEMYTTAEHKVIARVNNEILNFTPDNKMTVVMPSFGKFMHNGTEINMTAEIGLHIYYSEHYVHTQVTAWYFNKTCGLCGDYNGETYKELITPTEQSVKSTDKFGLSWLVEGDDCNDEDCKLMKQKIYPLDEYVYINENEMSCFSVEPVLTCQPGCRPTQLTDLNTYMTTTHMATKTKVGFYCVKFKESEMIRDRIGKRNFDLTAKKIDITKEISVPHECICEAQCKHYPFLQY
uniref:Vitellogenin-like n=1 Tax=Saccoglossus kowalevskii TaxID=10224 RepID=A0ABM0LY58_SACKO|nr:PREDICTED: vitellogenin-like [Saccoglossus kowalevskii]